MPTLRRYLRWLLYLFLALLLVLAAGFRFWLPPLVEQGRRHLAACGVELQGPGEIFWQDRTLLLRDLQLGPDEQPGLRLSALRLHFTAAGLRQLLGQIRHDPPAVLVAADLDGLQLFLAADQAGSWQLPGLDREQLAACLGPPADPTPLDPGGWAASLAALPVLTIRESRLTLASPAERLEFNLRQLTLAAPDHTAASLPAPPTGPEQEPNELSGNFSSRSSLGSVELRGRLAGSFALENSAGFKAGGDVRLELTARPAELRLAGLELALSELVLTLPELPLPVAAANSGIISDSDSEFASAAESVVAAESELASGSESEKGSAAEKEAEPTPANPAAPPLAVVGELALTMADLVWDPDSGRPGAAGRGQLKLMARVHDLSGVTDHRDHPEVRGHGASHLAVSGPEYAPQSRLPQDATPRQRAPSGTGLLAPLTGELELISRWGAEEETTIALQAADGGGNRLELIAGGPVSWPAALVMLDDAAFSSPLSLKVFFDLVTPELWLEPDLVNLLGDSWRGELRAEATPALVDGEFSWPGRWQGSLRTPTLAADLALTSELRLGGSGGKLMLGNGQPGERVLRLVLPDLRYGEHQLTTVVEAEAAGSAPLARINWQAGQWSGQGDLLLRLAEPLFYRQAGEQPLAAALAGQVGLAWQGDNRRYGLRLDHDLFLSLQADLGATADQSEGSAGSDSGPDLDLALDLGGALQAWLDAEDGHLRLELPDDFLLTFSGRAGPARLLQPASLLLMPHGDRPLLLTGNGASELAVRAVSAGPRLDLDIDGTRLVARRDALQLELVGQPAQELALNLELRELLLPGLFLAAERLGLALQVNPATAELRTVVVQVGRFYDAARNQRFADLGFDLALQGEGGRLQGDGRILVGLAEPRPLALPLELDLEAGGRDGRIGVVNNEILLGPGGLDFRRLLPEYAGELRDLSGRARLGLNLSWDQARQIPHSLETRFSLSDFVISAAPRELLDEGEIKLVGGHIVLFLAGELAEIGAGRLTAHLDGVNLTAPQASVFGIQGLDLELSPLLPPSSTAPLRITFDELSGFLPFERGKLLFSLEEGRLLRLHELEMYLGDGLVQAQPLVIDLANPAGELRLLVAGVQLARLREKLQIELRESLEVAGELAGVLPVRFSPEGVSLEAALLEAVGPGHLRYRPGDPADWVGKTGKSTMQLALSNFHYDTFVLALNGGLGEIITVDLHTAGANRDLLWGMPVDLKLKIHAALDKLLSAYSGSAGHAERTYVILD